MPGEDDDLDKLLSGLCSFFVGVALGACVILGLLV